MIDLWHDRRTFKNEIREPEYDSLKLEITFGTGRECVLLSSLKRSTPTAHAADLPPEAPLRASVDPEELESTLLEEIEYLLSMLNAVHLEAQETISSQHATEDELAVLYRLSHRGRDQIAHRLLKLIEIVAQDPDEGDLALESLKSIAEFFLTTGFPCDSISAVDGILSAYWRLPLTSLPGDGWNNSDGFLHLQFLPSGTVNCVMETRPIGNDKGVYFAGEIDQDQIVENTRPFFDRLNS